MESKGKNEQKEIQERQIGSKGRRSKGGKVGMEMKGMRRKQKEKKISKMEVLKENYGRKRKIMEWTGM